MTTWRDEAIEILKELGGHAYLKDIYAQFEKRNPGRLSGHYQASLRDILEKGSKESAKFDGRETFYMVEGKNKGHYGLINFTTWYN